MVKRTLILRSDGNLSISEGHLLANAIHGINEGRIANGEDLIYILVDGRRLSSYVELFEFFTGTVFHSKKILDKNEKKSLVGPGGVKELLVDLGIDRRSFEEFKKGVNMCVGEGGILPPECIFPVDVVPAPCECERADDCKLDPLIGEMIQVNDVSYDAPHTARLLQITEHGDLVLEQDGKLGFLTNGSYDSFFSIKNVDELRGDKKNE